MGALRQLDFYDVCENKTDFLTRKNCFLTSLRSPSSKQKYKRYMEMPLRYAGGKSLAVGYVLEHLPDDLHRIVSPFFGGGSVEVACAKELGIEIIGYDIFELLVNYWQMQVQYPKALCNELNNLRPTKEEYERIKNILKGVWNKYDGVVKNEYSALDLSVYYYFNHNLSYGPGFLGWMSSIYSEEKRYKSMLDRVKNFDVKNMQVFTESFETSIPKHNGDFLYLDPPYFLDGDSKMFKGIYPMRNFPIHHNGFRHDTLAKLLNQHTGGFILSYNDCSWVRNAYKDFDIVEVAWQYTMGQGETRVGKNRLERNYDNDNIKTSHELLIIG
jgi:DNA adenine methylase